MATEKEQPVRRLADLHARIDEMDKVRDLLAERICKSAGVTPAEAKRLAGITRWKIMNQRAMDAVARKTDQKAPKDQTSD